MKKIVLTSCGVIDSKLKEQFYNLLNKDINTIKLLFITIAVDGEEDTDRTWLEEEYASILDLGIKDENITIYDLHKSLKEEDLNEFDAIYVCGGTTKHLVARMEEIDFKKSVNKYIDNGGIYIGVSAGSICASGKYENSLGFIKNVLDVHCDIGTKNGKIETNEKICLTNNQAIFIDGNNMTIFE